MAFQPHALFCLVMMELRREPGVFALFLLKPSRMLFSVFIPGELLPQLAAQTNEQSYTRPKSNSPPASHIPGNVPIASTSAPTNGSMVPPMQRSLVLPPLQVQVPPQSSGSASQPPSAPKSSGSVILRPSLAPKGKVTVETVSTMSRPSSRIVGVATDQPKAVVVNVRPNTNAGPKSEMVTSSLNVNPAVAQPIPVKRPKVDPSVPVLKKAKLDVDLTLASPQPTATAKPVVSNLVQTRSPKFVARMPKTAEQISEQKVNAALSSLYQSLQRDLDQMAASPSVPKSVSGSEPKAIFVNSSVLLDAHRASAPKLPTVEASRRPSISNTPVLELEQKIKQLETELRQSKSKEALLITQAAQLKRLAEENQRLKRENDLFRSLAASSAKSSNLSSSSSGAVSSSGLVSPIAAAISPKVNPEEFMILTGGKRFVCAWGGCNHAASSRYVLRNHIKSAHLEPLSRKS